MSSIFDESEVTLLTLSQLINVALGVPEKGVICFDLLQNILQIIVRKLYLSEVKIEYRGKQNALVKKLLSPNRKVPDVQETTYKVFDSITSIEMKENKDSVIVINDDSQKQTPVTTVALSSSALLKMNRDIANLQAAISELKGLPSNKFLIDSARSSDGSTTPVTDMYQLLTLSKRMSAAEEGMHKMATLIEDITRGNLPPQNIADEFIPPTEIISNRVSSHSLVIQELSAEENAQNQLNLSKSSLINNKARSVHQQLQQSQAHDIIPQKKLQTQISQKKSPELENQPERNISSKSLTRQNINVPHQQNKMELQKPQSLTKMVVGQNKHEVLQQNVPNITGRKNDNTAPARNSTNKSQQETTLSGKMSSSSLEHEHSRNNPQLNLNQHTNNDQSVNNDIQRHMLLPQDPTSENLNRQISLPNDIGNKYNSDVLVPRRMVIDSKTSIKGVNLASLNPTDAIQILQNEVINIKNLIEGVPKDSGGQQEPISGADTASINLRFVQFETKLKHCADQIESLDTNFNNQFCIMMGHVQEIDKQFSFLSDKVVTDLNRGAETEELTTQNMIQLNEKFMQMENSFEKLGDAVTMLVEDKQIKQIKIDNNSEQIEMLKTDKIGREEYEQSMNEKVDICQINRKVSHDQFNQTCDDLSKGIEEALDKLLQQEELWNLALNEIQDEINSKLNKDDLTPLKDFVSDKLKSLQVKMKNLGQMKRDREAAATKNRLLRDVNCISCDNEAVMKKQMESTMYPPAPVLPAHQSIAPYLAYELDQLRKQQNMMTFSKNLHHFEDATQKEKLKGIINRYCGGQHTVTTPQQRVTRLGNFFEQWGPAVTPLQDDVIKGNDGHVYRGSVSAKSNDTYSQRPSLLVKSGLAGYPEQHSPTELPIKLNSARGSVVKNKNSKITNVRKSVSKEG